MAIRPTDLQVSFVQTIQNPPIQQRAEEAPRTNQAAAQAQFESKATERTETVGESKEARGNRIEVGDRQREQQEGKGRKRERNPGEPFEEVVEEAAGLGERQHLIDFTA